MGEIEAVCPFWNICGAGVVMALIQKDKEVSEKHFTKFCSANYEACYYYKIRMAG